MIILEPLLIIVLWLIKAYIWVIIIGVILSWLIAFNVVNTHNRFVFLVQDLTSRLTEPALRPIRRLPGLRLSRRAGLALPGRGRGCPHRGPPAARRPA